MQAKLIADQLSELFDQDEVKFKVQTAKGNRALPVAYIDARCVMDRLDEVVGSDNWSDDYCILPNGSVQCTLSVAFPDTNGKEWISKTDCGSVSEQPDDGDRMKSAYSDALKRAAVKFGIGRYLYRMKMTWIDFDPTKKAFVTPPKLPAWAVPKKQQAAKAEPAKAEPVRSDVQLISKEDWEDLKSDGADYGFTENQILTAAGVTDFNRIPLSTAKEILARMKAAHEKKGGK